MKSPPHRSRILKNKYRPEDTAKASNDIPKKRRKERRHPLPTEEDSRSNVPIAAVKYFQIVSGVWQC